MAYSGEWFAKNTKRRDIEHRLRFNEDDIRIASDNYIKHHHELQNKFDREFSLNNIDMTVVFLGALLQTLRWAIVSNSAFRFKTAVESDRFFATAINSYCPVSVSSLLTNARVPYDTVVRSPEFINSYQGYSTGLSGANHRYTALGHDPLIGLLVGTANIATNTVTVNDFDKGYPSFYVQNGKITGFTDLSTIINYTCELLVHKPDVVATAFLKQIAHSGTDVFTKQGLPIPIINTLSPQTSRFLIDKCNIDLYSVSRGAALAFVVDKLIGMIHRLFYNPKRDNYNIYCAKTNKVIMYSDMLASATNFFYVGISKDLQRIDIGGVLNILWRLIDNRNKVRLIKQNFVNDLINREYNIEEAKVRRKLSRFGIYV